MSRQLWSCNADGTMQVTATVWTIDEPEQNAFHVEFQKLLSDSWQDIAVPALKGTAKYRTCYYKGSFEIFLHNERVSL